MAVSYRSLRRLSAAAGYAVNPLNRMSERREDAEFIAALRRDPEARTSFSSATTRSCNAKATISTLSIRSMK